MGRDHQGAKPREQGEQSAMAESTADNANVSPTLLRIQAYSAWIDDILIKTGYFSGVLFAIAAFFIAFDVLARNWGRHHRHSYGSGANQSAGGHQSLRDTRHPQNRDGRGGGRTWNDHGSMARRAAVYARPGHRHCVTGDFSEPGPVVAELG